MSRVMKKGALRRFTAFLLAFCCLFSMAPTAFAADPDDGNDETQYRYVWLISQPGFAIRITQGNGGHRVQVRDMDLNHTPQPWIDCKLIESPTGDGQVYVADGNNMPSDLDNTLGGQRPAAQDGIGYVRLYTNFDRTVLPSSSIPNWEGTSFSYVQNMTRPLDPNRITEENEDIEYWAGNVSGGDSFYVTLGRDSWTQHVDTKGTDPYGKYGEKLDPESEGDVFPSPIRTNAVDQFGEDDTYYYAQVQIPKDIVDAYVLQNGYMGTGSNTDSFLNIGNNTMFQFRSENELPAPELDDIGTVIFDFNLPGEAAEGTYLEKGGTMVDVPGISTKQVQGVTFEFKGWFTEPEGGQQITDPQVEVEAGKYVVYYAQWELTGLDIPPEQMGEGDLFVGYFDYNLPGTGVTAVYCAAGTFEWTVTVDGESKTYTAQLPFQFPEDPYRAGYRFLGWATTPDATAPNVNESWLPTRDDNTVFGVWEEEIYDLTWDANGGQTTTTTEQKYNEEIQPPANEPTREGYTFGGWYLDANCTIPLASGSKVYGDQTFYAKWTSEKVFVNYYDTRQGTALVTTQEYNYGDLLDLLGPLENTDGWTFQHWATQDGTQATEDTPLVNPTVTYHTGYPLPLPQRKWCTGSPDPLPLPGKPEGSRRYTPMYPLSYRQTAASHILHLPAADRLHRAGRLPWTGGCCRYSGRHPIRW